MNTTAQTASWTAELSAAMESEFAAMVDHVDYGQVRLTGVRGVSADILVEEGDDGRREFEIHVHVSELSNLEFAA